MRSSGPAPLPLVSMPRARPAGHLRRRRHAAAWRAHAARPRGADPRRQFRQGRLPHDCVPRRDARRARRAGRRSLHHRAPAGPQVRHPGRATAASPRSTSPSTTSWCTRAVWRASSGWTSRSRGRASGPSAPTASSSPRRPARRRTRLAPAGRSSSPTSMRSSSRRSAPIPWRSGRSSTRGHLGGRIQPLEPGAATCSSRSMGRNRHALDPPVPGAHRVAESPVMLVRFG